MMITCDLEQVGHLAPEAWTIISSLPKHICFHNDHGKRHPKSTYGGSLRAITEQWVRTFKELDQLNTEHNWLNKETNYNNLLKEYKELLYRLNEHHDACLSVLRSLCNTKMAKPTIQDSDFLSTAKLSGYKSFTQSITSYREHIGCLVNTLKHRQGELCSIFFHSNTEFRPGYFLRDVLPNGVLGPSAKLHSDGRTAFSFNRDMLFHLWWLYRIGKSLSLAIKSTVLGLHKLTIPSEIHSMDDTNLIKLLKSCAAIKPHLFPNEKTYPRITLVNNEKKITLKFPTNVPRYFPKNMRISLSIMHDISHPVSKLPYFGKEYEEWEKTL